MTKQNDFSREMVLKSGDALMYVDAVCHGWRDVAVGVRGLSIRSPESEHGEYLVTVRGIDANGEKWVAFHRASTLMDLFMGLSARFQNGSLKWKEDQFK